MNDTFLNKIISRSAHHKSLNRTHNESHSNNFSEMLDDWFEQLKVEEKQTQTERLLHNSTPFLAIPTTVTQAIFHICEEFCQPPEVRYLTVELFDRFINNQFFMIVPKIWPEDDPDVTFQNEKWKEISERIKNQSLLRIMSCMTLSSKFLAFNKVTPMKKVQEFLQQCGLTFSLKTLLASEMRVYKILSYKLHFPNVLLHSDMMIELIELPPCVDKKWLHRLSLKIIDMCYLYHQIIYHKLFYYSTGRWEKTHDERKEFLVTECNNTFLAAAVVVTTVKFAQPGNNELSNQVAIKLDALTDIPSDDIIALSGIITMTILN